MKKQICTDAMIVGGGPAGLAAALALSRKNITVTVADLAEPPIDKPCGEGLMPDSLRELRQLGVDITPSLGYPFSGIRFRRGELSVESDFPEGDGLGVRRTMLHQAILEQVQQRNNIRLLWRSRVKPVRPGVLSVPSGEIIYRWLIGADGQQSMVRKWAGMDSEARVSLRFGARRHFELEPWTERMELYWADCGQMYVTPVSQKEICLVFLSRDSELRLEEALPAFPALCKRLDGAANSSKPRGAISATRVLKRVTAGRVALVGDASGSVDVITGEGMALSFRQAIALADAIEMGDLGYYATRHRELSVLPSRMANLMLLLDRHPSLQTRILYALSKTPSTFGKLLAAHVGRCSLPMTLATEVPKVAWNLLLAWNRSLESSNSSPSDSVQMLAN